jgi:hypothetical protein
LDFVVFLRVLLFPLGAAVNSKYLPRNEEKMPYVVSEVLAQQETPSPTDHKKNSHADLAKSLVHNSSQAVASREELWARTYAVFYWIKS